MCCKKIHNNCFELIDYLVYIATANFWNILFYHEPEDLIRMVNDVTGPPKKLIAATSVAVESILIPKYTILITEQHAI